MSILGSITSLAKTITDPGAIIHDVASSVLPSGVGGLVGDVAGAAIDFATGKELQALQHGLQGLKDLPQFVQTAGNLLSHLRLGGSAGFEPSIPPGRGGMISSGAWRNPGLLRPTAQPS